MVESLRAMKKLFAILLLNWGLAACQHQPAPLPLATDQVNALVGNAGYLAATGHAPTAATPDDARVQAHLAYAERLLRQRPAVDSALARRRAQVLDLLHRYWATGVFPRNHKYVAERRPCFIDRDGRLCAVGYLVAQTAGRAVAERINAAHQYDLIADMRLPMPISESPMRRVSTSACFGPRMRATMAACRGTSSSTLHNRPLASHTSAIR